MSPHPLCLYFRPPFVAYGHCLRCLQISLRRCIFLAFSLLIIAVSATATADAFRPELPQQPAFIPDANVLALSDDLKAELNAHIKPIFRTEDRARALHAFLFGEEGYGLEYMEPYTRTAMETFQMGGGNCVSLANLFVAAARQVGLKAYFQESRVQEDWTSFEGGYFVVPGHVNVLVKIRRSRQLTVEFLGTYQGRAAKTRQLNDKEALAQYYSNLGMLQLHEDNLPAAKLYMQKALDSYGESAFIWSNMGVIEKRLGEYEAAEKAYLKALHHDRKYISAVKNLYILYRQLDEPEKAQRYAAQVETYNRRNPYYLHELATEAMQNSDYPAAVKLLKQAIKIKDNEDKFHFSLARAYYLSGELGLSSEAMHTAEQLADNSKDRQRYYIKRRALEAAVTRS